MRFVCLKKCINALLISPAPVLLVLTILRQTFLISLLYIYLLCTYEFQELEGCNGEKAHIRTTPKRTLGVGHIQSLAPENETATAASDEGKEREKEDSSNPKGESFFGEGTVTAIPHPKDQEEKSFAKKAPTGPKSWAMLVNPAAASVVPPTRTVNTEAAVRVTEAAVRVQFGDVSIAGGETKNEDVGDQFDDADEDDDEDDDDDMGSDGDESDDDAERYADISDPDDISDEECDVYILDPEEVEERKRQREQGGSQPVENSVEDSSALDPSLSGELAEAFPSLAAAATVPYEGSDDEGDDNQREKTALQLAQEEAERKRQEALKPITTTKDGKTYNSFRKYGHVVASSGIKKKKTSCKKAQDAEQGAGSLSIDAAVNEKAHSSSGEHSSTTTDRRKEQSRIIGGDMSMAGKMTAEDDDGEGWITNTSEIKTMKASGRLDPTHDPTKEKDAASNPLKGPVGPPLCQRTACATTDFAMQNVILQMNLSLLTVDGVKVRRLKSWVTRCGACFAIYTGDQNGLGSTRLFCDRCGSDFMQRIAASVDGKTGRLKLHLSKKYKTNTRGTKFSLPAPGKGNRFEGDLLLREDQLMVGAWNQKVRKSTSKKEAQSIFGSDIASNVGCHADLTKNDNIKVGFGRRNPNSSKFGRERRGKKKKSSDNKACGLRRY
mmetsp:Transcript_28150/g.57093  ORF Transcript_28150/g.57093 Transcript_28150/m.57093 type:complete len:666 (-) Transcript_28150:131-2128(-)